jgi:hypothetical protein
MRHYSRTINNFEEERGEGVNYRDSHLSDGGYNNITPTITHGQLYSTRHHSIQNGNQDQLCATFLV